MKKLLLLAIFISSGAWADCELKNKNPADVSECYEKTSFTQVQKKFNELLNISKQQLSFNKTIISELNTSQKAWLNYRDSYCTTYSNYHTELNNNSNCIVDLNRQRVKQLQSDIDAN